jgi:hypothetical protein
MGLEVGSHVLMKIPPSYFLAGCGARKIRKNLTPDSRWPSRVLNQVSLSNTSLGRLPERQPALWRDAYPIIATSCQKMGMENEDCALLKIEIED